MGYEIFELDDDDEATGMIHFYCSAACRDRGRRFVTGPTADGSDNNASPGIVCETCGVPLA